MFRLSYYHNNCDNNHSWKHGSKVSVKTFASKKDAYKWIGENPQYTPLKLGAWDDDIECYRIIKDKVDVKELIDSGMDETEAIVKVCLRK